MKKAILRIVVAIISPLLVFTSCIKDELPNSEADILKVILQEEIISSKIENTRVTIFVSPGTYDDLTNIDVKYVITPGAKIVRGGDDDRDYSKVHEVEVVSEDGKWSKVHEVRIMEMVFPTEFHFENWSTESNAFFGKYDECYERILDKKGNPRELYIWASGNMGYRIAEQEKDPSKYPTYKTISQDDAHSGSYAAVLATKYIGERGQGSPLAAGNLFIGEFSGDGISIMTQQMKATRFGLPIDKKPTALKVWFKYKSGGEIIKYNSKGAKIGVRTKDNDNSGNNNNLENKDYAAIYAVMFDNEKAEQLYGKNYLDGETILSSQAEVGRAILTDDDKYGTPLNEEGYPFEYVYKDLQFTYSQPIDADKLKKFGYSLAIVFSSSYYGAEFQGNPDSKLWIDDVILECE